jgi:hypothetical protein
MNAMDKELKESLRRDENGPKTLLKDKEIERLKNILDKRSKKNIRNPQQSLFARSRFEYNNKNQKNKEYKKNEQI